METDAFGNPIRDPELLRCTDLTKQSLCHAGSDFVRR